MRDLRFLILMSYVLQAFTCVVSALCLYFAIDLICREAFVGVGVETGVALINAKLFVEQAAARKRLRILQRRING